MDTLKVMAAKRPVMTYEAHLTLSSMGYGIRFRRVTSSKHGCFQVWVMATTHTLHGSLPRQPESLLFFWRGPFLTTNDLITIWSPFFFSPINPRGIFFLFHDLLVSAQAPRPGCLQAHLSFLLLFFFYLVIFFNFIVFSLTIFFNN